MLHESDEFLADILTDGNETMALVHADELDSEGRLEESLKIRLRIKSREIKKNYGIDLPRLEYADILENYGKTELCDFIRADIKREDFNKYTIEELNDFYFTKMSLYDRYCYTWFGPCVVWRGFPYSISVEYSGCEDWIKLYPTLIEIDLTNKFPRVLIGNHMAVWGTDETEPCGLKTSIFDKLEGFIEVNNRFKYFSNTYFAIRSLNAALT